MTSIEKAKKPQNYGNLYQYLLWLSIFLLVFEDPIQQCFPIFGYYDEVFALFGGLYYLFSRRSKVFFRNMVAHCSICNCWFDEFMSIFNPANTSMHRRYIPKFKILSGHGIWACSK